MGVFEMTRELRHPDDCDGTPLRDVKLGDRNCVHNFGYCNLDPKPHHGIKRRCETVRKHKVCPRMRGD